MFRKNAIFLVFLLNSCVENLVNISVLNDGSYIVHYTSIGYKDELLDSDFKHPQTNKEHQWITSLSKKSDVETNEIWEKETILASPLKTKLIPKSVYLSVSND